MSAALKQSESNIIAPSQSCKKLNARTRGRPSCDTGSCGRESAKLNDIYLTDASRLILVWSGKDSQCRHVAILYGSTEVGATSKIGALTGTAYMSALRCMLLEGRATWKRP